MVFLKNFVESLNLNTLTQFNGYQWRCPVDLVDEDGTPVGIDSESITTGDIVEVTITRHEDNGKYYHTLGVVLEEAQTCHGEYLILYGPFDDSFRYADFFKL